MPNRIRRVLYDNEGAVLATGSKIAKYLLGEYAPLYPDPNSPLTRRAPGEFRSHWLNRLTRGLGRGYMLRQWREQRGVRGNLSNYWRELRRTGRNDPAGVAAQLDPATNRPAITFDRATRAWNFVTTAQQIIPPNAGWTPGNNQPAVVPAFDPEFNAVPTLRPQARRRPRA